MYRMCRMNHIYRMLLATVALAFSSVIASASTITVCASGCDYTSINATINAAIDGDVIQLAAETYFEGSQTNTLGKAITLRSVLDKAGITASVLDGAGTHRVLICQSGETGATAFQRLVIQDGFAFNGGGMPNIDNSSPELTDCTFIRNSSNYGGGLSFRACGIETRDELDGLASNLRQSHTPDAFLMTGGGFKTDVGCFPSLRSTV